MKRSGILLFVFAATSCSNQPASGPAAGKAYFSQAGCTSCHRVGDEGSSVGPDLTLVGFRHSPQWIDRWLQDPKAWKPNTLMSITPLSPGARAALVAYLSERRGQDWPPGKKPWDDASLDLIARGRKIYARAGCVACHGLGGAGGYPNNNVRGGVIPALLKVSETFTKKELVEKIRRGVPSPLKAEASGPEPLVSMPAWGEILSDPELDAVASYLLTLTPAHPEKAEW